MGVGGFMKLILFLVGVVGISLSGVMAPGPLTAAAVAMGAESPYAGLVLALGHGVIEFPLIALIVLGASTILKSVKTKMIIGMVGGIFLLLMAFEMFVSLRAGDGGQGTAIVGTPLRAGLILSIGNPYFLMWWATIGLKLATDAKAFGVWALALFAIVHWLCDLVWLAALSLASFKGSALLGANSREIVLAICSAALLGFGLYFLFSAGKTLIKLIGARNSNVSS